MATLAGVPETSLDPLDRSHAPEYIAEFLGTAAMVFFGLSAVVFDFAPDLFMAHWLPDLSLRRLVTGLCFAATGSLVAISPLGRLSGGHINPAVSLAFFLDGKMRPKDFLGYVFAQMLGGIVGAALLSGFWGRYAHSVQNGMTRPGLGVSWQEAFVAEMLLTGLLVFLIFFFVSSRRLMRWTPVMTWLLVATMVWQEAAISGTSLNPARSFGPALITGLWRDQWLYFAAPLAGGVLGWAAFWLFTPQARQVITAKLYHVAKYRSIFQRTATDSAAVAPRQG